MKMKGQKRIAHLLDDVALGGVTRALENFRHPDLNSDYRHEIVDVNSANHKADGKFDIGIVHFTMNWKKIPLLISLRASRRYNQLILVEHSYTEGFEQECVKKTNRFHRMLRLAYTLADTVVAVSKAQSDWMMTNRLCAPGKILVISQSRDCTGLQTIEPPLQRQGPLKIGAYGRFHEQKGFDLLLKAMAGIPPTVATLTLAGKGPQAHILKCLANGLPHVTLLNEFVSPDDFLPKFDCIAIPSRWEAFGLVGTEARSAARPLIAAYVDGLIGQIGNESFGHTTSDVESLRSAILKAAHAKDIPERGQTARTIAASEFHEMVRGWKTLLDSMTSDAVAPNASLSFAWR